MSEADDRAGDVVRGDAGRAAGEDLEGERESSASPIRIAGA
jgi:hypothetical protein